MTLTEEQREAIRVISKLPMAIGCQLCHPYIMENYGSHFIVLRDMIDSSGTVEPTGGFDLERARGLRDFLQDDCAEVGDVWAEMVAEIERLRSSLIDLHAEYINTLEKNPGCSAWDLDEQSEADQRRLRKNAAHITSTEEPLIYLQVDQQAARIKDLEADLEQAEIGIRAGMDVIDDQAAQIKELESSLDEAEALTKKNAELMNGYLGRIAELEDALVEERAGAIRCEFYDHCEIDLPDAMIRARQELQADGKIGPDAKPRVWQITEERKAALSAMSSLRTDVDCPQCDAWLHFSDIAEHAPVLRTMLREAE